MEENDISSSTKADTRSAENIIFDIMAHKAGKKNEKATINKEYESIKDNIDGIVEFIQFPLACTKLCSNKYAYKSQLGNKKIMKEVGNAYRNTDFRPSDTKTWWGKISHKFKQAVNYVAPIALTTLGVAATAFGGLAAVMTGGSLIPPLSWMTAGLLGTTVGLQFGQGTTKHNGVSDANYYTQKVDEIMDDNVKDKDVDKLKENVVTLTKALVKLQSGLIRLKDEEVMKYCQKLKDLVECIQKKEAPQEKKSNNIDNNIQSNKKDLYDKERKNSNNQSSKDNNLNVSKITEPNNNPT